MIHLGFLLLLIGAALLQPSRARRAAGLAVVAAGLALAGHAAAPAPDGAAPGAALLVLGVVLALGSAALAVFDRRSLPTAVAAAFLGLGGALLGWGGAGLVTSSGAGALVASALVQVAVGAGLVLAGRYIRFAPPADRATPHPLAAVGGLLAGALAAGLGPHVALVFLGVLAAAASGYLLQLVEGGSRLPVVPVAALFLVPAWWLMAAVAGPSGLRVDGLAELPFSPAAEQLLAIPLLLAAWALAGLWPLHRQLPGALVAPVGAFLLARVAFAAVPDGLEHWRPLAMPLIVVGVWHAALSGRLPRVAVAMAWVGLLAPGGGGLVGAAFLLASGLAVELVERVSALRAGRLAPMAQVLPLLAFGWGALLAVSAALRGEVVYTVLAVAALVALCGRRWPQAITASAPSTTSPSA
jgi:hypothetical protein